MRIRNPECAASVALLASGPFQSPPNADIRPPRTPAGAMFGVPRSFPETSKLEDFSKLWTFWLAGGIGPLPDCSLVGGTASHDSILASLLFVADSRCGCRAGPSEPGPLAGPGLGIRAGRRHPGTGRRTDLERNGPVGGDYRPANRIEFLFAMSIPDYGYTPFGKNNQRRSAKASMLLTLRINLSHNSWAWFISILQTSAEEH